MSGEPEDVLSDRPLLVRRPPYNWEDRREREQFWHHYHTSVVSLGAGATG